VQPKNKGLWNPSKNQIQLPAINKNPTQNQGHNPRVDLCPLIEQKMKKLGDFLGKLVSGFMGNQWGREGIWVADGGWVQWRSAGGGVSVVGEVMGGGGLRFGVVFGC
jgi:hypothetical protein